LSKASFSKILHSQILLKMKICLRNPEFSWNPLTYSTTS